MRGTWALLRVLSSQGLQIVCGYRIYYVSLKSSRSRCPLPSESLSDGRTSNKLVGCLYLQLTIQKTGQTGAQLSQKDVVRIKPNNVSSGLSALPCLEKTLHKRYL